MKKILITGISGFAGSFLAEYFTAKENCAIYGTTLSINENSNLSSFKNKVILREVNLLNKEKVTKIIEEILPEYIFHLAALSSPKLSFQQPSETIINNISAQVNLLEAVREIKNYKPKILIVSSADVYGKVKREDLPINENTPLNPTNPYAVSKITQDFLGLQYYYSYGFPIIRVRPFNHIGPRQALNFVVSDFAKRIVDIEKGKIPPVIHVGELNAKRDFTDVRDMVRAYNLILERGKAGDVYNIGSGISHKIEDLLYILLSFSKEKIAIESDPELIRPADNPELVCDFTKMKEVTGWRTEITFEQSLKDTLDYWRNIS